MGWLKKNLLLVLTISSVILGAIAGFGLRPLKLSAHVSNFFLIGILKTQSIRYCKYMKNIYHTLPTQLAHVSILMIGSFK